MSGAVRQELELAGWKLAREDQPGIYIREESVMAEGEIDWTSEPAAMLRDLERVRARRERHQRRKKQQRQRAFDALGVSK